MDKKERKRLREHNLKYIGPNGSHLPHYFVFKDCVDNWYKTKDKK